MALNEGPILSPLQGEVSAGIAIDWSVGAAPTNRQALRGPLRFTLQRKEHARAAAGTGAGTAGNRQGCDPGTVIRVPWGGRCSLEATAQPGKRCPVRGGGEGIGGSDPGVLLACARHASGFRDGDGMAVGVVEPDRRGALRLSTGNCGRAIHTARTPSWPSGPQVVLRRRFGRIACHSPERRAGITDAGRGRHLSGTRSKRFARSVAFYLKRSDYIDRRLSTTLMRCYGTHD